MTHTSKAILFTSCASFALAFSPAVFAQDEATDDDSARKLPTITVTSQKREESLQDVPISVTAITGETLEDNGVATFENLSRRTPNLQVQVAEGGPATIIGIRGIASGFNRGFEQSVGVVVDGVYNSRGEYFRNGLMDIERVEVLRGPQGTLFGKNATAGLINVVTADPTDSFEAFIKTRAGTDDLYGGQLVISGPITEGLQGRLVLDHFEQGAYVENTGGGIDGGEVRRDNIRLKLLADPTDNLTLRLTYEHLENSVEGTTQEVIGIDPSPTAGFFGYDPSLNPYDPGNGGAGFIPTFGISSQDYFLGFDPNADFEVNHRQSSDLDSYFDTTSDNFRVQADYEFADHTITYVGGYTDLTDFNLFDPDFSANPYLFGPADVQTEQITHELRIQSPEDQRFTWTAGVYKFDLEIENSPDALTVVPPLGTPPSFPPVGMPPFFVRPPLPNPDYPAYLAGVEQFGIRVTQFEQETDAWAVFAQGTFEVNDRLRVTVGGRYTDETKTSNQYITSADGTLRTPAGDVGVTPIVVAGVFNPNPTPAEFANSFDSTVVPYCRSDGDTSRYVAAGLGAPCGPGLKRTESKFTPMVNAQYDFSDNINGYISWSEGFKGGGFNGQARREQALEYEEETVEAFELGLKSTLFDGTMTANIAAYHSTYEDFQTTQFINQVFIVGNAGEVTSQGIEADVLWQATDTLRLGFSGAWTDVQYEDFPDAACTNAQQTALNPFNGERAMCNTNGVNDLSGREVENAPELSGNLFAVLDVPLANQSFDAQLGADISYTGEHFLSQNLDPNQFQDAYSLINLRASLLDKDEKWELALLGRNVTDEIYLLTAAGVPAQFGADFGSVSRGSVVEVQFNWFFR
ncbi:MAG: TonB-dependent receptor [Pseudomonadota bacterium]